MQHDEHPTIVFKMVLCMHGCYFEAKYPENHHNNHYNVTAVTLSCSQVGSEYGGVSDVKEIKLLYMYVAAKCICVASRVAY